MIKTEQIEGTNILRKVVEFGHTNVGICSATKDNIRNCLVFYNLPDNYVEGIDEDEIRAEIRFSFKDTNSINVLIDALLDLRASISEREQRGMGIIFDPRGA